MPQTHPIAFGGCAGHLTLPTRGPMRAAGVVLCRSWGVDELCSRKFLRTLAEALAEAGFPVLRFDYPGTVDSADLPEGEDLAAWADAADAACDQLRQTAGCRDVVLFGLGIGALIADMVAARRDDAAGLILAAPVTNGRRYLRETGIHAKVVLEGLGLSGDPSLGDEVAIGGLVLAPKVVAALTGARLDAAGPVRPVPHLVVARETAAGDREIADQRLAADHPVKVLPFDGYDRLMGNPLASVLPSSVIADIARWVVETCTDILDGPMSAIPGAARVMGPGFEEEGVVFREGSPLFGILCRPAATSATADRPIAVFLSSGYDHHGGWARCWVETARSLARMGIPSLRFDVSNIGDSPPFAGDPDRVLYTDGPIRDVSAALDYLAQACPGRPVLVGRCSGAYAAFHAACGEPRVTGLALVNQLRFIWDPAENPANVSSTPRSVAEYKRRLTDANTLRRLLKGDINVPAVLRGFFQHGVTRVAHLLAPVFPTMSKYGRFRAACHGMFRALDRRAVPVFLLSSEGDESLEQLALYFGKGQKGLRAFRHVTLETIPDADHNMTPLAAQAAMREKLCAALSTW